MQFRPEHLGVIVVCILVNVLSIWIAQRYLSKHSKGFIFYLNAAVAFASVMFSIAIAGGIATYEPFEAINLLAIGVFIFGPLFLLMAFMVARRSGEKIIATIALSLALLVVAIGIDAFVIEPKWLDVTFITLKSAKITRPVKIAVLSDLQTDQVGDYERKAIEKVMAEKPDLILMPGDYIQCIDYKDQEAGHKALNQLLKDLKFSAPLGVYAVRGNVEVDKWPENFAGLPVTSMPDSRTLKTGELAITGLSFDDSFNQKVHVQPAEPFHIVFGHGPDFSLAKPPADMMVAGHTHGGQVQLPLFGPPMTLSAVPRDWAQGTNASHIVEPQPGSTLILSRGVGMERRYAPRLRFLCRPQLIFVNLEPESKPKN
jgi:predicted MPP superfamily phosphohydrolase